jgi:outer membrane protein OmpA-like peptidoglycan-associated protein
MVQRVVSEMMCADRMSAMQAREDEVPTETSSSSSGGSGIGSNTNSTTTTAVRRGSMKDRFDDLIEENKKNNAEKVSKLKESRNVQATSSIKNKWQDAVANHKDHEHKKFEETKESTMSNFRGGNTDLVKQLIKKFNRIFLQKRVHDEKFISRYGQLKERAAAVVVSLSETQAQSVRTGGEEIGEEGDERGGGVSDGEKGIGTKGEDIFLKVTKCPEIIVGAMECVDLTDSPYADEIRALFTNDHSFFYPEVGLFGEGDDHHHPPIEVSSLISLTSGGGGAQEKLILSLRMDVLPSHIHDLKSYGHQKVIFYLPAPLHTGEGGGVADTSQEHGNHQPHELGQAILEFEFELSPSEGWEEFHRQAEERNTFDPVSIMKTHNSFFIKPIDHSIAKHSSSSHHTPSDPPPPPPPPHHPPPPPPTHQHPPPPPPPRTHEIGDHVSTSFDSTDSPCGSEPVVLNPESNLTTSTSGGTEGGGEQEDRDGYLLVSTPPSAVVTIADDDEEGEEEDEPLAIVTNYVPSILYHESHPHRLIPISVLDPHLDLTQFTCSSCLRSSSQLSTPLLFACPDCHTFLCQACSQGGNGVKGSIETKQIELNAEILFKPGFSSLLTESYLLLDQIVKFLLDNPIPIRIEGHINAVQANGTLLDNSSKLLSIREPNCNGQMLSMRRAEKVKDYLVSRGIAKELLEVVGHGGKNPLTRDKNLLNKNRSV